MWEDIIVKDDAMKARYVESLRHTIQVDWIPYFDEIAELVGCKPNFSKFHPLSSHLPHFIQHTILNVTIYSILKNSPWYHKKTSGTKIEDKNCYVPHFRGPMNKRSQAPLQTRKLATEKSWGFFQYTLIVILVYVFFALLIL